MERDFARGEDEEEVEDDVRYAQDNAHGTRHTHVALTLQHGRRQVVKLHEGYGTRKNQKVSSGVADDVTATT